VTIRLILHELVATTGGAFAAIFLDFEGETVDLVCERDLSDHDLRIIGAYQGIFLGRIREVCAKAKIGEPRHFKLDFAETAFLATDVKDGYYVVLLADHRHLNESMVWRKLDECREKLLGEM
jgi:hypothetical protein